MICREPDDGVLPMTIQPDGCGRPQLRLKPERLIDCISHHDGIRGCTTESMAEDFRRSVPSSGLEHPRAC